jgi:hypothetical protein
MTSAGAAKMDVIRNMRVSLGMKFDGASKACLATDRK